MICSSSLNRLDNNFLGFSFAIGLCPVSNIFNNGCGLRFSLIYKILHQNLLSFIGGETGYLFEPYVLLLFETVYFLKLFLNLLALFVKLVLKFFIFSFLL